MYYPCKYTHCGMIFTIPTIISHSTISADTSSTYCWMIVRCCFADAWANTPHTAGYSYSVSTSHERSTFNIPCLNSTLGSLFSFFSWRTCYSTAASCYNPTSDPSSVAILPDFCAATTGSNAGMLFTTNPY